MHLCRCRVLVRHRPAKTQLEGSTSQRSDGCWLAANSRQLALGHNDDVVYIDRRAVDRPRALEPNDDDASDSSTTITMSSGGRPQVVARSHGGACLSSRLLCCVLGSRGSVLSAYAPLPIGCWFKRLRPVTDQASS